MKEIQNSKYFRISVTNLCNLNCKFCHNEGQLRTEEKDLSISDILFVSKIAQNRGYNKFKITGGEPTLRSDLYELIHGLKNFGIGDVSMITNGINLKNQINDLFMAGLDRINVSLFALDQNAFKRNNGGNYEQLLRIKEGIIEALRLGYKNMKLNYIWKNDIIDFKKICQFALSHRLLLVILPLISQKNSSHNYEVLKVQIKQTLISSGNIVNEFTDKDDEGFLNTIFVYETGLQVMLKLDELGQRKPFRLCEDCIDKQFCRESIFPIRLSHNGTLIPCLVRNTNRLKISQEIFNRDEKSINEAFNLIEML